MFIHLTLIAIFTGVLFMLTETRAYAKNSARVVKTSSGPILLVNGKPTAPIMLQVGIMGDNTLAMKQVKWAGQNGINIVSPTLWGIPWTKEGNTPTLDGTDIAHWIESSIQANPQVLLIPRFPIDQPPAWWAEQHPDDMMKYQDGSMGLASVHSKVFRKDAAKQIANLIAILEKKYPNNIIGYHVCGQNSAEWFYEGFWDGKYSGFEPAARDGFRDYLRKKYKSDRALRKAWNNSQLTLDTADVPTYAERNACSDGSFRDPIKHAKAIDFDIYQNKAMADCISDMCKAVKHAVPNRLAIAFYGYTLELSGSARSGHIALAELLKSPYIDAICAPYSYGDREPGGSGRFMGLVDSMLAHGKLFITEDDTRTFLTDPSASPGRCADLRQTEGVLTRNFAHVLTRGAGLWWMEPVGNGVFASEPLMKHNGKLIAQYQSSMRSLRRYQPEVAVIVDEASALAVNPFTDGSDNEGPNISLMVRSRYGLYRMGAPFGVYLLDDLEAGKVPPAKLYIMLNTFKLDKARFSAIKRQIGNSQHTILWMYAPGYLAHNKQSPKNITELTGIGLRQRPANNGKVVTPSGELFDAMQQGLSPIFTVDDPQARPLAKYEGSSDIAIAYKQTGSCTSIYCGLLQMSAAMLRTVAQLAGVHIFNDQDSIVMVGNGYVAMHATATGRKTLHMPKITHLIDAVNGQDMGIAQTFTADMQLGDTILYKVVS